MNTASVGKNVPSTIAILADVVFDLKSSSSSYDQANDIIKIIRDTTKNDLASRISVRYLSASKAHDKILSEVFPDHVFDQIESGTFPSYLKIYMNAPSKEACLLYCWLHSRNKGSLDWLAVLSRTTMQILNAAGRISQKT